MTLRSKFVEYSICRRILPSRRVHIGLHYWLTMTAMYPVAMVPDRQYNQDYSRPKEPH